MKNLFLVVSLFFLSLPVFAQPNPQVNIGVNLPTCINDLEIKLFTYDVSTSSYNGESPWLPVPPSGGTYDYSAMSSYISSQSLSWVTDPGTPGSWHFSKVQIKNCAGSPSTGSSCMMGNFDWVTLDEFVPADWNNCFEYSGNCTSCGSTTIIGANMTQAGPVTDVSFSE